MKGETLRIIGWWIFLFVAYFIGVVANTNTGELATAIAHASAIAGAVWGFSIFLAPILVCVYVANKLWKKQ